MRATVLAALAVFSPARANPLGQRQSNWTIGQTVQTSSGVVNGHAASNATEVSEYLGIPYAAPPVGDLRFAAPQKYSGNSTINGTSFVRATNGFERPRIVTNFGIGIFVPSSYNVDKQRQPTNYCKCQYYRRRSRGFGNSRSNRR
jgi:hypothetical protein